MLDFLEFSVTHYEDSERLYPGLPRVSNNKAPLPIIDIEFLPLATRA